MSTVIGIIYSEKNFLQILKIFYYKTLTKELKCCNMNLQGN